MMDLWHMLRFKHWLLPMSTLLWILPATLGATPLYKLEIIVRPESSSWSGNGSFTADHNGVYRFSLHRLEFHPGGDVAQRDSENSVVSYELKKGETVQFQFSGSAVRDDGESAFNNDSFFLSGDFFPQPDSLSFFQLKVRVPAGYELISEAESISKSTGGKESLFNFHFPHPLDSVRIAGSNQYRIRSKRIGKVIVDAYFYKKDASLSSSFFKAIEQQIKKNEANLGPFPYRRFSVVEGFLPVGISMPTMIYIGQQIIRMPFIMDTSLGHEIVHQWMGNSVYVDYKSGNWCEGLTTYLADQRYQADQGKGELYRHNLLSDYQTYVKKGGQEISLKNFISRYDRSSQAIGYGKGAMLFHMLRKRVGDKAFFQSLRNMVVEKKYQKVSWGDIEKIFQKHSKEDLRQFFDEWVNREDIPGIEVEHGELERAGAGYRLSFILAQKQSRPYELQVPVIISDGRPVNDRSHQEKRLVIHFGSATKSMDFPLSFRPGSITLDPDYDLARSLAPEESPANLSKLFESEKVLLIVPESEKDNYRWLESLLPDNAQITYTSPDQVANRLLKENTIIIAGNEGWNNPVYGFASSVLSLHDTTLISVRPNPWNSASVAVRVLNRSSKGNQTPERRIYHYGRYSDLKFHKNGSVTKESLDFQRGIVLKLTEKSRSYDSGSKKVIESIISRHASERVWMVGESHQSFAHHSLQLNIIKELYERNHNLAIGMEMFEWNAQPILDQYIAGKISEKEFLKKTDYFSRWRFDYRLYAPILQFARSKKIPVIALNIPREIVSDVMRNGVNGLKAKEMAQLPESVDFSNQNYRDFIQSVFQAHGHSAFNSGKDAGAVEESLEKFLQSQIIWDESMASTAALYLKKHPDKQIVLLTGSGHLIHRWGIPDRLERRSHFRGLSILPDENGEENAADISIKLDPDAGNPSPVLGIMLVEEKDALLVKGVETDSSAGRAGIQTGDELVELNGKKISTISDLRIALYYAAAGEQFEFSVRRNGKNVDIVLKLDNPVEGSIQ